MNMNKKEYKKLTLGIKKREIDYYQKSFNKSKIKQENLTDSQSSSPSSSQEVINTKSSKQNKSKPKEDGPKTKPRGEIGSENKTKTKKPTLTLKSQGVNTEGIVEVRQVFPKSTLIMKKVEDVSKKSIIANKEQRERGEKDQSKFRSLPKCKLQDLEKPEKEERKRDYIIYKAEVERPPIVYKKIPKGHVEDLRYLQKNYFEFVFGKVNSFDRGVNSALADVMGWGQPPLGNIGKRGRNENTCDLNVPEQEQELRRHLTKRARDLSPKQPGYSNVLNVEMRHDEARWQTRRTHLEDIESNTKDNTYHYTWSSPESSPTEPEWSHASTIKKAQFGLFNEEKLKDLSMDESDAEYQRQYEKHQDHQFQTPYNYRNRQPQQEEEPHYSNDPGPMLRNPKPLPVTETSKSVRISGNFKKGIRVTTSKSRYSRGPSAKHKNKNAPRKAKESRHATTDDSETTRGGSSSSSESETDSDDSSSSNTEKTDTDYNTTEYSSHASSSASATCLEVTKKKVKPKEEQQAEDYVSLSGSNSTDIIPNVVVRSDLPPIRPSFFPFVPPFINFCLHDEKAEVLPPEVLTFFKWRLSTITPVVIKKTVANSGFRLLRKTVDWGGQWGKHMKSSEFRTCLKDFQKLNHIPATFQIGRKDRLWKNLKKFIAKFGKEEFGFMPKTFILPGEFSKLKHAWNAHEKNAPWIIKPPAGARGTGIRVINKWLQVPRKKPMIVQMYIANPLLINGRKFDLRLYVLVTSFHPLKIYLYNDGLVRFAPVKYSHDSKRVGDRYMHLTNYSVNKNCDLYMQNEDANSCQGHKWTLKTLWRYLNSMKVNTDDLWTKLEDIVIKTLICGEDSITATSFNMPNRYNGYELFGFDIILDETYKPWLLEVNISPSLHSSSPLDLAVKGPLVKEVFNIVGYHLHPKIATEAKKNFIKSLDLVLDQDDPTFDKRLYTYVLSKDEKMKHQMFKSRFEQRKRYKDAILEELTPDDVRVLINSEDELSQCVKFARIFPTSKTYSYFHFFESSRYYNMLFDAWEERYEDERSRCISLLRKICLTKMHLEVATASKSLISESPESIRSLHERDSSSKVTNSNSEELKKSDVGKLNSDSIGRSNCHDIGRLASQNTASPVCHKGVCF